MIAALRTVVALVVLSFYILLVSPPVLLWTALARDAHLLFAAGNAGVRLALALVGIRVLVKGRENIQVGQATVYAANHQSHMDGPAVFSSLAVLHPKLCTIYKKELRALPVLVWAFDAAGFVPIERANREQSFPAVDRAAQSLVAGNSFFIFPEGTRSRTGELQPFKKGGFLMAIAAQVPVVPVAVSGGRDAMRKGSGIIRPVTITVDVGRPISTSGLSVDDRDALIARVHAALEDRLPRSAP